MWDAKMGNKGLFFRNAHQAKKCAKWITFRNESIRFIFNFLACVACFQCNVWHVFDKLFISKMDRNLFTKPWDPLGFVAYTKVESTRFQYHTATRWNLLFFLVPVIRNVQNKCIFPRAFWKWSALYSILGKRAKNGKDASDAEETQAKIQGKLHFYVQLFVACCAKISHVIQQTAT